MSINLSKKKIIALAIIGILIIICIVLGITYSFMRPINETSSITSISLDSCAHITLTDTGDSIDLENSYPMSRNRALQTTPYTFTISSSCADGSSFNLYLATLNTNTLPDSSIHYIITEHGNKNIIVEGILSDATNGLNDFKDYELSDLNNGINGTYGSIYRLYTGGIQKDTEVSYDLYLYIDESVTNETMSETFSAGVAIKASDYDFATVDEITVNGFTTDSITVSVNATPGANNIKAYYYSINNGEYVSSTSNTYIFSGLEVNTEYNIKVYVEDSNGVRSNIYEINQSTENTIYLADYIKNIVYQGDGINGLYYHDGIGNYENANQEAGDNSYRYSGANPNNFVCFGSNEEPCPEDNLYRIIGVYTDEVKLIRANYATSAELGTNGAYQSSYWYYWNNDTEKNTWSASNLNKINLNQNYINNIESTWSDKIAITDWKVGGMSLSNGRSSGAKTAYNYEVGTNSSSTTYRAKIGLVYVSDYYYGASPTYWTYPGYGSSSSSDYRAAIDNNWMHLSVSEWTISHRTEVSSDAFYVNDSGYVSGSDVTNGRAIRPCFYLKPEVAYLSGDGSLENPYIID